MPINNFAQLCQISMESKRRKTQLCNRDFSRLVLYNCWLFFFSFFANIFVPFFSFFQLDDWVLCRIYNKKGHIEKNYPRDNNFEEFPEIEDKKPDIVHHQTFSNDHLYMATSDSTPKLHTDSSSSEHVLSPEITCEREVQSEPKWNYNNNNNNNGFFESGFDFNFNGMDGFLEDPFGSQVQFQMDQLSPLQDMFTFLQNSF